MFMNAYLKKGIEVLEALSVDRETGLTCAQAEENRKKYGANSFTRAKRCHCGGVCGRPHASL